MARNGAGMRRAALAAGLALAALGGPAAAQEGARGEVTNLPLPRFVSVRADEANARRGPSLEQRVDWAFTRRGWPLEVTAEYGHWRRVRDVDGAAGWVHHSLLSGTRTVLVQGEGMAAIHAGAAEDTAIRAYLEPGVVAELDRCEAGFCLVDAEGVRGWIASGTLWGVGTGEDAAR